MRVHDSQAYRKMNATRERISRILELREIFLSFQTGFNSVNAAGVCAILESISGLESSSVTTEPRYLKLVTVSSFCLSILISVLLVIRLVFWALISMPKAVEALSRRSTNLASSFSAAKPSMSSAKRRLVIVLPQMLTVPSWSSKASVMIFSRNMLKRVDESRHPCRTPTFVRSQSPMLLLKRTALVVLSQRFLMTLIRFVLMLYFFMVAHKAACQTVSKAFLKSIKTW